MNPVLIKLAITVSDLRDCSKVGGLCWMQDVNAGPSTASSD